MPISGLGGAAAGAGWQRARGLAAGARVGGGRAAAAGTRHSIVSRRLGLATLIADISASLTPAASRRGRNVRARYV